MVLPSSGSPLYLIYQPGKVASTTILNSMLHHAPRQNVRRSHILSETSINQLARICDRDQGDVEMVAAMKEQVEIARRAWQDIQRSEQQLWVITGFRDPLTFSVAAFFQNLQYFCPSITLDASLVEAETDVAIEEFRLSFEAFDTRRRAGRPPGSLRELLLEWKLRDVGEWFDKELKQTFDVEIHDLSMGKYPYIIFETERCNIILYRFEQISKSIRSILDIVSPQTRIDVCTENIGDERASGLVYKAFKNKFVPSPEMLDYYRGSRFYKPFYDHQNAAA